MSGPTKSGLTPDELREDALYGVLAQARGEAQPLGDVFLFNKIRAAEDHFRHEYQILFGDTRIVSNARRRLLDPATYDLDDPAYDWDGDFYCDRQWGKLALNWRPVSDVTRFFYAFPGSGQNPTTIPPAWVNVDYLTGTIEIIPIDSEAAFVSQLWGPILHMIGPSGFIPKAIHVDYTAGISPTKLRTDHADLLEALRIRSALFAFGVLTNVRTGGLGSQSLSLDGLSRSESYNGGKWGPYSGAIEQFTAREQEIMRSWVRSEHGQLVA